MLIVSVSCTSKGYQLTSVVRHVSHIPHVVLTNDTRSLAQLHKVA